MAIPSDFHHSSVHHGADLLYRFPRQAFWRVFEQTLQSDDEETESLEQILSS